MCFLQGPNRRRDIGDPDSCSARRPNRTDGRTNRGNGFVTSNSVLIAPPWRVQGGSQLDRPDLSTGALKAQRRVVGLRLHRRYVAQRGGPLLASVDVLDAGRQHITDFAVAEEVGHGPEQDVLGCAHRLGEQPLCRQTSSPPDAVQEFTRRSPSSVSCASYCCLYLSSLTCTEPTVSPGSLVSHCSCDSREGRERAHARVNASGCSQCRCPIRYCVLRTTSTTACSAQRSATACFA